MGRERAVKEIMTKTCFPDLINDVRMDTLKKFNKQRKDKHRTFHTVTYYNQAIQSWGTERILRAETRDLSRMRDPR